MTILDFNKAKQAKEAAEQDYKDMKRACFEAGYIPTVDQEAKDKLCSTYNDNMLLYLLGMMEAEEILDDFNEEMDND